ncbi:MAG TPA: hypothetical protein VFN65_01760 [Solirubrobacteraceae bacterium]|nr:hypothetical protein [Solirubrobacteraceae bacterium]
MTGEHEPGGAAHHTPAGVDDRTASTLTIADSTEAAALAVVDLGQDDPVMVGGAAGGVGVVTVQLARLSETRSTRSRRGCRLFAVAGG